MTIKLNHLEGPFGDATSVYEVSFSEGMTISDFLNIVITQKSKEWGNISLSSKAILIDYKYGHYTIRDDKLYNKFKDKKIKKITAHGGWSSMDYIIEI